jgi:uncharacterized protein YbbC (DUF1343 family)/CubicO group peptidase (beta-lactamase class C family)
MYRLSPPALPCPVLVRPWRLHLRPAAILLGTVGLLLSLAVSARSDELRLPVQTPESAAMDGEQLRTIDDLVAEGIAAGEMPGCVVLVARRGGIVWLKAYGNRQVEPQPVTMTTDTVFDLASLTKPVATATSVMKLGDEGRLRLDDRVAKHIPEFGQSGKQDVTVYDLLTHQSGLTPANSLRDFDDGPQRTWERIFALGVRAEPGTKFSYSDVGYLVLAELVRRVSGQDIHEFSRDRIYQPLGMRETGYLPGEALRERAAPTERRGEQWMRGEVHDPRAFLLGGVAGHAGLFSTAEDLAVYAQMMLDRGRRGEVRVLSERAVAEMTAGYPVPDALRGLGWDVRSGYSSNRGAGFSPSAFGHGGFTGTAMWIDPQLELIVIFLSNRLHPDGRGSVNRLAGRIGSVAAGSITDRPKPAVLTGIDVLQRDEFQLLAGRRGCEKIGTGTFATADSPRSSPVPLGASPIFSHPRRVGLITNQTGINRDGVTTIRLLAEAKNVDLVALFSPEHGLQGRLDVARIADGRDDNTGLPVFSLYGESRKPTAESLEGIDTLVFDIQDIGARFYTYISTMGLAMEAAAEHGLRFVVLDRPNPIGGVEVSGPMLDPGRESFVGYHRLPVRHGMTIGELAGMFRAERKLDLDLQVVRIEGWRRGDDFDRTALPWINPSPNMRSTLEALLYPGIGLLETTNLSVGRGTELPFEVIGAPWLDGAKLAERCNALDLPGVRFVRIAFAPTASKFAGQRCGGVRFVVTDRDAYQSVRTGLHVAVQLRQLHPDAWQASAYGRLLGNQAVLDALLDGRGVAELEAIAEADIKAFVKRREAFLLYSQ